MKIGIINKDRFFYPVLMIIWTGVMLVMHHDYSYLRRPFQSLDLKKGINRALQKKQIITSSIDELRLAYKTEKDPIQKLHILHNIGVAYYDMNVLTKNRALLDSAAFYFKRSLTNEPQIARFYYNLGRTYTTIGKHIDAREYYEKAIAIKPDHILALHNLGLVYYFELKRPDKSEQYLKKLLQFDRDLPICNYVLGEIYLDKKDYNQALTFYTDEVNTFRRITQKQFDLPIARKNMQYATATAYLRMATIFATKIKHMKNAQLAYLSYLALETDMNRKKRTIPKMQSYGLTQ